MDHLKMYIVVRDDIDLGHAVNAVGHASLACYLKYKDLPEMSEWLSGIFYKVTCLANEREFELLKNFNNHVIITEISMEGREVALAFAPRKEWPKAFKFLRLLNFKNYINLIASS